MISNSPCKDPIIEIVWNSQFTGSYFCTWISHVYDMYNTFNPFEIIHLLKPKYLKSMFDNQNFCFKSFESLHKSKENYN
jgi:hypothetical protein